MKKEALKKIIAQNLKVKPSPNFTDKLMKTITATANEALLKTTLKAHLIHPAPDNFATKVLQTINKKEQVIAYKPVISKTVWYLLGLLFTLILILGLSSSDSKVETKYRALSLDFFNSKINLLAQYLVSNSFLSMLLVSILSLILIDMLFKSARLSKMSS